MASSNKTTEAHKSRNHEIANAIVFTNNIIECGKVHVIACVCVCACGSISCGFGICTSGALLIFKTGNASCIVVENQNLLNLCEFTFHQPYLRSFLDIFGGFPYYSLYTNIGLK